MVCRFTLKGRKEKAEIKKLLGLEQRDLLSRRAVRILFSKLSSG